MKRGRQGADAPAPAKETPAKQSKSGESQGAPPAPGAQGISILDKNSRSILSSQAGVAVNVHPNKETMRCPPKLLPYMSKGEFDPNKPNDREYIRSTARKYWDVYHTDTVIGIARKLRNTALFSGGWNWSDGTSDGNGNTVVDKKASDEVLQYLNEVLTPFFSDVLDHLYCFGLVPFVFRNVNGRLQPIVPELETFEIEVWLNADYQQCYTFIEMVADRDEDVYGRNSAARKMDDHILNGSSDDEDGRHNTNPFDADFYSSSDSESNSGGRRARHDVNADGTRFFQPREQYDTDQYGNHTVAKDGFRGPAPTMPVNARGLAELARQHSEQKRQQRTRAQGSRAVTRDDVSSARAQVQRAREIMYSGSSPAGGQEGAKHGEARKKTRNVFRHIDEFDLSDDSKYAKIMAQLNQIYTDIRTNTNVIDLTDCVFFIVLQKPDYSTGQFNSDMSRMYNDVMRAREFKNVKSSIAKEMSRRPVAFEENGKVLNESRPTEGERMQNAEFAGLESLPGGAGSRANPGTIGIVNSAMSSYTQGQDSRVQLSSTTEEETRRRNAARMESALRAISLSFSRTDGKRAQETEIPFTVPDILVPPGWKLVNPPTYPAQVDLQQEFETYVQMVALTFGITGTAIMQNTSGKGLSSGTGNAELHSQTVDMCLKHSAEYVCNIARTLFRLMAGSRAGYDMSIKSVPYDWVYVRVNGKLELYDKNVRAGGAGKVTIDSIVGNDAVKRMKHWNANMARFMPSAMEKLAEIPLVQTNAVLDESASEDGAAESESTDAGGSGAVHRAQANAVATVGAAGVGGDFDDAEDISYPVFPPNAELSDQALAHKNAVMACYNEYVLNRLSRLSQLNSRAKPALGKKKALRVTQRYDVSKLSEMGGSGISLHLNRFNTNDMDTILKAGELGIFDPHHIGSLLAEKVGLGPQHLNTQMITKMKGSGMFPSVIYQAEQALEAKNVAAKAKEKNKAAKPKSKK